MRPIKFRAWDKQLRKLCNHGFKLEHAKLVPFRDYILMQYTGLKDQNGKEIYEGDIVRATGEEEYLFTEDSDKFLYKIEFRSGAFRFDLLNPPSGEIFGRKIHLYPDAETETAEVIGNIYENKELLKNED